MNEKLKSEIKLTNLQDYRRGVQLTIDPHALLFDGVLIAAGAAGGYMINEQRHRRG